MHVPRVHGVNSSLIIVEIKITVNEKVKIIL